jgi:DNA-binding XRE family transcriptional regulator
MDLADRYKVSGPAIFKVEKGYVTPSLKLWRVIAADMGIAEKEAVLMWVRQKLPSRYHFLIRGTPLLDIESLRKELEAKAHGPNALKAMRDTILNNPDITSALKKFVAKNDMWNIFKPTAKELVFLVELDRLSPLISLRQFREAMIAAREIQGTSG